MNIVAMKIMGSIMYLIGGLILGYAAVILIFTGGMAMIMIGVYPILLLFPVLGIVLVKVGKNMIKNTQKNDTEKI